MKKLKIITAILLAAALCGCSNKDTSSQDSSASSEVSSAVDSTVQSTPTSTAGTGASSVPGGEASEPTVPDGNTPDGVKTFITGLTGEPIYSSEISTVFTKDGSEVAPEGLTRENFSAVLCDGFIYLAEPTKISRNIVDNADVYDSENMQFSDTIPEKISNYKRYNVGDTICGLTLKDAQVNFAGGAEMGLPEIAFVYGAAMFDGELTMTGYLSRAAADSYSVMTGDLMFIPSDGEADFPVMSYTYDEELGYCHSLQYASGSGFTWLNEFGYVYLGNADNTTADLSELPSDGSFVKVTVTVDNLMTSAGVDRGNSITAEIVDISY